MAGNCHSIFTVKFIYFFFGMILQSHVSEVATSTTDKLFISVKEKSGTVLTFFTDEFLSYSGSNKLRKNGIKVCFDITSDTVCKTATNLIPILNEGKDNSETIWTFCEDVPIDIVLRRNSNGVLNISLIESKTDISTDVFLDAQICVNDENVKKNMKLRQDKQSPLYNKLNCTVSPETKLKEKFKCSSQAKKCYVCKPQNESGVINTIVQDPKDPPSINNARNIMKNLSSLLDQLDGEAIGKLQIGNITGVISYLLPENQTNINYGFTKSGDLNILEENSDLAANSLLVQIPKEASIMAVEENSSFCAVLLFPGMQLVGENLTKVDPNSFFLNDEVVAIEMGAKISNLTQTVNITFLNINKSRNVASCKSWDGKDPPNWITDGCETKEANASITCLCSHLTFFAVLMSPPSTSGNISTADLNTLKAITSAGCGVSLLFLAVALTMHFLIRKARASQGTKILMNLFIAMFFLNLTFLTNETIAGLGNVIGCIAIAAALHYSMLATFTWFFMQALHLFFNLLKVDGKVRHYTKKIYITGWAIPAVVVIFLLGFQKYNFITIYTDDGNSAQMCWIPDAKIHRGVNIGSYGFVFVFTLSVFISIVCHISKLKAAVENVPESSISKINFFTLLSLFILLGITWGFSFFAVEPLLKASYYIFTIVNSFQGFFLFIYYCRSVRHTEQDKRLPIRPATSSSVMTLVTSSG